MATSLTSPALVFSTDKAIIAARKALAKVALFATDFSADAVQPGTKMKIPVFTPGTAAVFNAETNNYEKADGSVVYPEVTFDQHVKNTFQFDDKDFTLVNGTNFWTNAGKASGTAISKAIASAVSDKIVGTSKTATLASITKQTAANLRKVCAENDVDPSTCVIMLSPEYFATLLSTLDANIYGGAEAIKLGIIDGLYGFKAVIENSDLGSNVGAIVPEDALVVAGRVVPVMSPSVYEEVGQTTDEVSGLVVGVRRHGNPATGANFCTHEALFGAALAQADKVIKLVKGS